MELNTERVQKPQPRPSRGGRRGRDRDDHQVIGMGDHVPAFLLQPIRPTKRKGEETSSVE